MAKINKNTNTTQYSKSKTSIFLCCFRSHLPNKPSTIKETNSIPKQKRSSWFSWRRIRIKTKSTSKTVPLEASFSNVKAQYSKSRSKSTILHGKKSQAPATNPPPSTQPPTVLPSTPYYTPTQTRHGPNPNNNIAEDHTREQRPKRQDRRLSSTIKTKTTSKNLKNARSSYDSIVGMSVLVVTLVIMIFWGRFCAILCTSAWLYFIPRLRNNVVVNDDDIGPKVKSNDIVDLDSEEYKKKVIMEGLLGRNNRGNI
ncbi:uncharacterized protein [Cicer arietinum]|uniref:Uncharacterized protein At5g23160 n=1 Tax=Cicer arietinum TaxID=3827 RepID=A0A1S2Y253_CICAR|nr:uncharacterized protein At5g23160 [Cicer arietinum]